MKVTKDKYLYFRLKDHTPTQQVSVDPISQQVINIIKGTTVPYYISSKVLDYVYKHVNIDKFKDLGFLKDLPEKEGVIIINEDMFIVFHLVDTKVDTSDALMVLAIFENYDKTSKGSVKVIEIYEDMHISFDKNETHIYPNRTLKEVMSASAVITIKLLLYMYFSETEIKYIKGNSRQGTKRTNKIVNSTPHPFKVVDIHWNTEVINGTPYPVAQHWRQQAYGPNWSKRRPVLIKPQLRKGRKRKPTKQN